MSSQEEKIVEPNSFEDFDRRFVELQIEAKSYGIASLVGLACRDPLSGEEAHTTSFKGGYTSALGLAEQAKWHLLNDR